jgi:hypothetical protein
MNQIIISSVSSLLFGGVIASLTMTFNEFLKNLETQGVHCDACLGTGLDVSSKLLARPCKRGCAEDHESPYWDLAQALR